MEEEIVLNKTEEAEVNNIIDKLTPEQKHLLLNVAFAKQVKNELSKEIKLINRLKTTKSIKRNMKKKAEKTFKQLMLDVAQKVNEKNKN